MIGRLCENASMDRKSIITRNDVQEGASLIPTRITSNNGLKTIHYPQSGFSTDIQSGTDVQFWFNITQGTITKKNTILVLPSNDTNSVNATLGTNKLRFTTPDMSFSILMVYVNDAGNSDFDAGMNTIIVPTPILFGSRFWNMTNTTDQVNVTTDLPDYMVNASWTMYNDTNVTSLITFVISFNCTASEASELLSHFLHNVTGNKTCWYDDITDEIYTVGLPIHVTNFLPSDYVTFVRWEGQGEDPADNDFPYLSETYEAVCSVGNGFRDGVEYYTGVDIIDGFVWVFETFVDLYISCVQAVWEWGLGAAKSAVDALDDIKDAVQDALNFMVEWISEKISCIFLTCVNNLEGMASDYIDSIISAFTQLCNDISWFSDYNSNTCSQDLKAQQNTQVEISGISFILSFLGLQDKGEELNNVMKRIMEFIQPFIQIINPNQVMKILLKSIGSNGDGLLNPLTNMQNIAIEGINTTLDFILPVLNDSAIGNAINIDNNPSFAFNGLSNYLDYQLEFFSWFGIEGFVKCIVDKLKQGICDNLYGILGFVAVLLSFISILFSRQAFEAVKSSGFDVLSTFWATIGLVIETMSFIFIQEITQETIIIDFIAVIMEIYSLISFFFDVIIHEFDNPNPSTVVYSAMIIGSDFGITCALFYYKLLQT